MESINGDLTRRVSVDTESMDWAPSPSGTVWRKRVHLVGEPESGQVTSIVRYEPNSSFHAHDHPEGEEILVLNGVFSDEHGDWPAGTYLLNPEGFRHTPFSREGCELFVKLRQYPGLERQHVVIQTRDALWDRAPDADVERLPLYSQPGFSDSVELQRWPPDTDRGGVAYPDGAELFLLDGDLEDEAGHYGPGTWIRLPEGSEHNAKTTDGCVYYLKRGGLRYLRAA